MSVRVLVADDSIFMRTALTRMLESDPSLTVVGTATHGLEALEKAELLDPDVVTLDLDMPRLDGLKTLSRMMQENPRPVIVVSALSQEGAEAMLAALDNGAFDCIGKPLAAGHLDIVRIREDLIAKVKAAAAAKWLRRKRTPAPAPAPVAAPASVPALPEPPDVIAIGASTGGPMALQRILSQLPADLPSGVVIVQHMPRGFTGPFARRLDSLCRLSVREAAPNDVVEPGVVLLAPAGVHLTVCRRGSMSTGRVVVRLCEEPADARHIPSVDVMMTSVAETYGDQAMGVLLTGMGADGARGMKEIRNRGGYTVGQDEASCAVYGMPRSAAEMGALSRVVTLEAIAGEIVSATTSPVVVH